MDSLQLQLDNSAMKYIQTKEEQDFNNLFNLFISIYKPRFNAITRSLNGDIQDVEEYHVDAFLNSVKHYNPEKGKFSHLLNFSIRNKKYDYLRKRRTQSVEVLEYNPDEFSIIKNTVSTLDVEKKVVDKLADKEILEMAGDNETLTRLIYLVVNGDSINKASKKLGMGCHKTAKRRLCKLFENIA